MTAATLQHQALLYPSPEDFVATAAPLMRGAIGRGDPVFAATTATNVAALREELGDDAERVVLEDTTSWCTRPYERLQAFRALVAAVPPDRSLFAMGEPVWEGSDAVVRQWARYESIINLALAHAPMRFICLYDAARLPDNILEYAERTHPSHAAGAQCGGYCRPGEWAPGSPPSPPAGADPLPVEGTAAFRRLLARSASRAGLRGDRLDDVLLAATEVVTNALLHGAPPVRAHVWVEGRELVCQVADAGRGVDDPLAGWLPPSRTTAGGWGLAIARQVVDALDVARTPRGSVVSLHVAL